MDKLLALSIDDYGEIQRPGNIPTGGLTKGFEVLNNVIMVVLISALVFTLAMLLWGGISWITSGGDKTKVESARKKIIYSILGLIVIFFSFFIINIVGGLFGLNPFNPGNPSGGTDNSRLIQECLSAGGSPVMDRSNNYVDCNF